MKIDDQETKVSALPTLFGKTIVSEEYERTADGWDQIYRHGNEELSRNHLRQFPFAFIDQVDGFHFTKLSRPVDVTPEQAKAYGEEPAPFTLDGERFSSAVKAFLAHAPGTIVQRCGEGGASFENALIQALKAYGALAPAVQPTRSPVALRKFYVPLTVFAVTAFIVSGFTLLVANGDARALLLPLTIAGIAAAPFAIAFLLVGVRRRIFPNARGQMVLRHSGIRRS